MEFAELKNSKIFRTLPLFKSSPANKLIYTGYIQANGPPLYQREYKNYEALEHTLGAGTLSPRFTLLSQNFHAKSKRRTKNKSLQRDPQLTLAKKNPLVQKNEEIQDQIENTFSFPFPSSVKGYESPISPKRPSSSHIKRQYKRDQAWYVHYSSSRSKSNSMVNDGLLIQGQQSPVAGNHRVFPSDTSPKQHKEQREYLSLEGKHKAPKEDFELMRPGPKRRINHERLSITSIWEQLGTSSPKAYISPRRLKEKRNAEKQRITLCLHETLPKIFMQVINTSNGVKPIWYDKSSLMKYFVGKGNNSTLIKRLLAKRGGWLKVQSIDSANFVWTQGTKSAYIAALDKSHTSADLDPTQANTYLQIARKNRIPSKALGKELQSSGLDLILSNIVYSSVTQSCNTSPLTTKIWNRLEFNFHLDSKEALFHNMTKYYTGIGRDVFSVLPETYHITTGVLDHEFEIFTENYVSGETWIIKPGENSNRGNGITVCNSFEKIQKKVSKANDTSKTYIVQKYITNPLLIHGRKFDIRCFALLTSINGHLQGYFYKDGYIRTSSQAFSMENITDKMIHLTNDAVQKNSDEYGKFENGNKMSYSDFQEYLDTLEIKANFKDEILPKIQQIVLDTILAVHKKIDVNNRQHWFELFGYDFMIDTDLNIWLIEVNSNPCLDTTPRYLAKIIPSLLDNTFRIALDPLFAENAKKIRLTEKIPKNRYELIFSSVHSNS